MDPIVTKRLRNALEAARTTRQYIHGYTPGVSMDNSLMEIASRSCPRCPQHVGIRVGEGQLDACGAMRDKIHGDVWSTNTIVVPHQDSRRST